MGKKAVLVYVSLMTRVIVDDTASEQDIMELAVPKLSENLMDSPFESIEDIKDDIECPYSVDDEGIDEWTTSDLFHYLLNNELIPEDAEFEDWKHDRTDMIGMVKENFNN
jgi:hypothetical protein